MLTAMDTTKFQNTSKKTPENYEKQKKEKVRELEDFFGVRELKLVDCIAKMFRAYNRAFSPNLVDNKARDLSAHLSRLDDAEIVPFFDYVNRTEESLPTDKRLREVSYYWKKNDPLDINNFGYYDRGGAWTKNGTFLNAHPNHFKSVIMDLNRHQIEMLIKAKHGLVEHDDPELETITNRKYWIPRGSVQFPRDIWGEREISEYEKYLLEEKVRFDFADMLEEKYSKQEKI